MSDPFADKGGTMMMVNWIFYVVEVACAVLSAKRLLFRIRMIKL